MEQPTLSAGPYILRTFEDRDAPLIHKVAADPLIPLISTVPTSRCDTDALAFISRQRMRCANQLGASFAIACQETGEAVGHIGLWFKANDLGRASIGYWVSPTQTNKGVVSAALNAISDWGLTLPKIHRLELYVEPWNEGSWRAAQRAGYQREGLLRSWEEVGGQRKDMYMYARLRAE